MGYAAPTSESSVRVGGPVLSSHDERIFEMSSKDELFDGAIHRSVVAQTLKQNQYAEQGRRAAQPYIDPGSRYVDVPLATMRERITGWIDNAPYEEEKFARMAYQEAFEAEINKPHPDCCLCDECAAFRYAVTGEPD